MGAGRIYSSRWSRTFVAGLCAVGLSVVLIGPVIAEPGGLIIFSTSGIGEKGNAATTSSSLSAGGTMVAFQSVATNLDQADVDAIPDIYVKDLATGELSSPRRPDTGEKGNDFSLRPSLSANGTRVAFLSGATNLDPTDDHPEFDVYVKDVTTGDIMLASSSDAGERGNFISYYPSLSADGSSVAFASLAWNLDPADPTMDAIDIYVKDLSSGDITLVSTTANGEKSDGTSFDPSLSADGTTVAFYSDGHQPGSVRQRHDPGHLPEGRGHRSGGPRVPHRQRREGERARAPPPAHPRTAPGWHSSRRPPTSTPPTPMPRRMSTSKIW